ncbi:hypothetical protein Tco_0123225 [Tanacetum coccineum]
MTKNIPQHILKPIIHNSLEFRFFGYLWTIMILPLVFAVGFGGLMSSGPMLQGGLAGGTMFLGGNAGDSVGGMMANGLAGGDVGDGGVRVGAMGLPRDGAGVGLMFGIIGDIGVGGMVGGLTGDRGADGGGDEGIVGGLAGGGDTIGEIGDGPGDVGAVVKDVTPGGGASVEGIGAMVGGATSSDGASGDGVGVMDGRLIRQLMEQVGWCSAMVELKHQVMESVMVIGASVDGVVRWSEGDVSESETPVMELVGEGLVAMVGKDETPGVRWLEVQHQGDGASGDGVGVMVGVKRQEQGLEVNTLGDELVWMVIGASVDRLKEAMVMMVEVKHQFDGASGGWCRCDGAMDRSRSQVKRQVRWLVGETPCEWSYLDGDWSSMDVVGVDGWAGETPGDGASVDGCEGVGGETPVMELLDGEGASVGCCRFHGWSENTRCDSLEEKHQVIELVGVGRCLVEECNTADRISPMMGWPNILPLNHNRCDVDLNHNACVAAAVVAMNSDSHDDSATVACLCVLQLIGVSP